MGIAIKPGTTETAKRELWCFCAAYPVNRIGEKDGVLLFWLPAGREDEAACFEDMEHNTYCGTFDAVKFIMEGKK